MNYIKRSPVVFPAPVRCLSSEPAQSPAPRPPPIEHARVSHKYLPMRIWSCVEVCIFSQPCIFERIHCFEFAYYWPLDYYMSFCCFIQVKTWASSPSFENVLYYTPALKGSQLHIVSLFKSIVHFLNCSKIHITKFAVLTTFKCTVQLHEVRSPCHTVIDTTLLQNVLIIQTLKLSPH